MLIFTTAYWYLMRSWEFWIVFQSYTKSMGHYILLQDSRRILKATSIRNKMAELRIPSLKTSTFITVFLPLQNPLYTIPPRENLTINFLKSWFSDSPKSFCHFIATPPRTVGIRLDYCIVRFMVKVLVGVVYRHEFKLWLISWEVCRYGYWKQIETDGDAFI